ncbi:MAG: hypothetical protein ACLFUR_04895, partial [Candidatus Hadarchaeia archaeon]
MNVSKVCENALKEKVNLLKRVERTKNTNNNPKLESNESSDSNSSKNGKNGMPRPGFEPRSPARKAGML